MSLLKNEDFEPEMTQDGDGKGWGLILWLNEKGEAKARKKAAKLIDEINAGALALEARKKGKTKK